MKKKFECPRCGAGVRPDDIQCGRCGELLREVKEQRLETLPSSITVERVMSEEETSIMLGQSEYLSLSRQKQLLADREKDIARKEREVAEREQEMLRSIEDIEKDNRSLEEAMRRVREDEAELRAREKVLKDREKELESLTKKLEKGMKELEVSAEGRKMTLSSEEFEKLVRLRDDYQRMVDEGKTRLRSQIEEELKDRFERMAQLEQQLRAAEASLDEKVAGKPTIEEGGKRVAEEVMMKRTLDAVTEEMSRQIGAGLGMKAPDRRIRTHVEKLDSVLEGGIPAGSVVLLNGMAGTMKSTLAYHILHHSATLADLKGMYFSLEQSRDSLIRQMERLGMPREKSRDNLMIVDMVDLRKRMKEERGDWRNIMMRYVKNVHAEWKFDLFVLDSLESFKALTEYELTRQDMKDLFDWFKSMEITVLVISERAMSSLLENVEGELYLADGAVELIMKEVNAGRVQRWMRVMKMRGADIDPRYYAFSHDGRSFNLSVPLAGTH